MESNQLSLLNLVYVRFQFGLRGFEYEILSTMWPNVLLYHVIFNYIDDMLQITMSAFECLADFAGKNSKK